MLTTEVQGNQTPRYCLSTDEKPIDGVENGTPLVVMNTDGSGIQVFLFDGENKKWIPC